MTINKIFLIDKPKWISSFYVIKKIRAFIWEKKVWHTGTLDPLASGLLIVATGKYTKLIPHFEKDNKTYEFEVCFDWNTDSLDLETPIKKIPDDIYKNLEKTLTIQKIEQVIKDKFTWKIKQIPPKYSALKIWWKKAFELVKSWVSFEMKERENYIYEIEILDFCFPKAKIRAKVSSWTYVRSIAFDIWQQLWAWWYVTYLRRTDIRHLNEELSQKLDDFDENNQLSISDAFPWIPQITLTPEDEIEAKNWRKILWDYDINLANETIFAIKNEKIISILKFKNWELWPTSNM